MNEPSREELLAAISTCCAERSTIRLMEVCGTHTVSLFRTGARSLLPKNLRLISGPGCPVCVTSQAYVDLACDLAGRDGVTICTYGDMVRVPGTEGSLEIQRGRGARVVVVYSPRDALHYAVDHPAETVVFLAVGFETTAPATAATVLEADASGAENFYILPAHKLVTPAMETLLSAGDVPIDGFLCPGHVSVILGTNAYRPIAERYAKPCVVGGFELDSMLRAICRLVEQVQAGVAKVDNAYSAAVRSEGNPAARALVDRVFQPSAARWRAMGEIPASGLELREAYRRFDAREYFGVELGPDRPIPGCRCGEVIQGRIDPPECGLFGSTCTPSQPVGPCMVSSEGSCAAWYKYRPR